MWLRIATIAHNTVREAVRTIGGAKGKVKGEIVVVVAGK